MGVKGLAAWLREQYPEAYTFLPRQQQYDHVYVDLPSILHTVARKSACQPCHFLSYVACSRDSVSKTVIAP